MISNPFSGAANELDKAAKGLKGEINKITGGGSSGGKSTGEAGSGFSFDAGSFDSLISRLSDIKLDPPVVEAPAPDLPSPNLDQKLPDLPSPNLDQDLTKGTPEALQEAAIKAGSDVQDVAIKTGSDVQAGAIQAGSDVQAGVSEIVNQTGVKNETLEKIIESNVSGTEASIESNVKGTEASIESNVQGTENTIQDFTKKVEEIGTLLTQPFQDQTSEDQPPPSTGDTTPPPEYGQPDPLPGPEPDLTFGADMTAQEQKNRNRLLASSRYGRSKTILTGGSGLSSFGI